MPATRPSTTATRSTRVVALMVAMIVALTSASEATAYSGLPKAAGDVTVKAPTLVKRGAPIAITITTDAGYDGAATLYYRLDDKWVKSSLKVTLTDGKGEVSWKASSSRGYYIALSDGASSAPFAVAVEDSSRYALTAVFSAPNVVSGEMVWARGYAYRSGKKLVGATIVLEHKKVGRTTWSAVTTATTSSIGKYSFRVSPSSSYAYRVRISGRSTFSAPITVVRTTDDRTLEARASQLSTVVGAATSSVANVPSEDLPDGVSAARYRHYSGGTLFEITTAGRVKTWLVYDRIGTKYKALNGVDGKLGLPMRDPKCGLLERGCVQRFYGGSIYVNNSSMSPGAYVAYGTRIETELLAVAYSQVGYEEPSWRVNKYTNWLGSRPAWCMTWVAWAAAASGNGSMIPKSSSYESYLKTLKASGRLKYSGVPPSGSVVLFDWGSGTPSHTGYVTSRSGNSVWTLEGNTTDGSGDPQRGVYKRKRAISYVWAWYWPSES